MTVADQLRQEVRKEGRDEVLSELLNRGFSPKNLSEITGIAESEIRMLNEKRLLLT